MIKKDYMGILVVNHYVADEPKICFDSQIEVKAITEIALHEAYLDDNGKIQRGELLSHVHMSDLQFGKIISKPNSGSGQSVTLNNFKGHLIDSEQIFKDPKNTKLDKTYAKTKSLDDQILRFLKEINIIIDEFQKTGKMSAKTKKELENLVQLIKSNSLSNHRYSLECLSNVANNRLNEAKSELHHLIRDSYRGINAPIDIPMLENKGLVSGKNVLSPMAKMGVSHVQGRTNLFDAVSEVDNYITLSLHGLDKEKMEVEIVKSQEDEIRSGELFINNNIFRLCLTLEQYSQFVRADQSEVPCTIQRFKGTELQDKVLLSGEEVLLKDHGNAIEEVLSEVYSTVDEILELLDGGITKKANKVKLMNLVDELNAKYQNTEVDIVKNAEGFNSSIFDRMEDALSIFTNTELKKLPVEEQKRYRKLVSLIFNNKNSE
jgi:ribosomal protein L17